MLAFFSNNDESDFAQDLQVLRHGGLSHAQGIHQFTHTHLSSCAAGRAEQLDYVAAGRVRECIKDVGHSSVAYKEPPGSTMASGHR